MIRPDRVIALRGNQTVFQYKDLCAKVYSRSHSCVDVLREAGNLAAAWEGGAAGVGEGGFGSVPAPGSSAARSRCVKSSERLVNTSSAKRVTPFLGQQR